MSIPNHLRRLPNEKETINVKINGRGGLCFTQNVFVKQILTNLNLEVDFVAAAVSHGEVYSPNGAHMVLLLKNLCGIGSLHIADCGFGFPSFPIIPIDFDAYSPIFSTQFGVDYRFRFDEDRRFLIRQHRGVPWWPGDQSEFVDVVKIDLSRPVSASFLAKIIEDLVYGPMEASAPPGIGNAIFVSKIDANNRLTLLRGGKRFELANGGRKETEFHGRAEVAAGIKELLPFMEEKKIALALDCHEKHVKPL